jgi:hypothetical protein
MAKINTGENFRIYNTGTTKVNHNHCVMYFNSLRTDCDFDCHQEQDTEMAKTI